MDDRPATDLPTAELDLIVANVPSIWVSRWEAALAAGDYVRAAEADRELRRLGVRLRLAWTSREPAPRGAVDAGAAP